MTQFSCKSVVTVNQLAVDNYTAAHACAEGDHYKIFQTAGHTVGHLAYCGGIGIIGYSHRYAEFIHKHLRERHRSGPRQIDTVLYHACEIIGIGGAHAYAEYLALGLYAAHQTHGLFVEFTDIVFNSGVLACFYRIARKDYTAGVNNAENSVCATHVDTYYIRF